MVRKARVWYPGAVYHVMSRGNRKQQIFMDDHDRYVYLKLLEEVRRRFGVRVYAFCLMGNHVHLMIQTGDVHLSVVMKFINMRFAVFVNRKYGLVGHVFQGRFRSKMVMDLGYARELMRYIHMNPVAAGLVEDPRNWGWSSMGAYVGKGEFMGLVDVGLGLGLFGGQVDIFLKFVGSDPCGNDKKVIKFYQNDL